MPSSRLPRTYAAIFLSSLLTYAVTSTASGAGQPASHTPILPPIEPWDGASRALVVEPDDPWITPAEASGLTATPRYDETFAWLRRLAEAAPQLHLTSIGRSDEGREIWMVVASREGHRNPEQLAGNGKPTVLAQAGIHSGEIDGKDAGMMLLRDMTVGGKRGEILDSVNLLFIPILSVDGHERFSAFSRVNQRGPEEMGWRTNRRNLNLNRDYAKLDTPELRAVVRVINDWQPVLYLDFHVTDGVDYQYDITFGNNGQYAWSPNGSRWLDEVMTPAALDDLEAAGHIGGPLILANNGRDLSAGFPDFTAGPRFSNGYGDARHLPTVLVENHSLKPFDQRVLGTYVFFESVLRTVGRTAAALRQAIEQDRASRPAEVSLGWAPQQDAPELIPFKAIRSELEHSPITGNLVVRWTGEAVDEKVPFVRMDQPTALASRPSAYYVPAAWREIVQRLELHGIEVEALTAERTAEVEMYRVPDAALATRRNPFEGHARVTPGELVVERSQRSWPAGTFRVSTDQPLGTLAMLLLEPESADSYFQWGFMLEILNRTEYIEAYAMEPMARRMLAEDPQLAAEFRSKLLSDREFAGSPRQRLQWFYEQTPFYDREHRLYPIAREVEE
ncbi:MAG: M14 family metallopeptidase [Acidobacteriota bacterium]